MRLNLPLYLMLTVVFGPFSNITAGANTASTDLPRHAIVFVQHSDAARQDYDIWQIAADGTQLASVVVLPHHQAQFTISPKGDELIYVDSANGVKDLWRRGFHSKKAVNLTASESNDTAPSWSPDGSKVLFSSNRDAVKNEIYLMSLDTQKVERLTNNQLYDSGGRWAPDGSKIIFTRFFPANEQSKSKGHGAIFEYDLDTKKEKQLTDLAGYNGGLDYSPKGEKIAFHRVADNRSELWVMDHDGTNPTQLTNTFIDEYSPTWSPDGEWLAYTAGTGSDGHGTFDLWLMRADGSEKHLVSAAANTQMSPQWRAGNHYLR